MENLKWWKWVNQHMESMLHLQMNALTTTTHFEIDDLFYVNNKSGEEKDKIFYWDSTRGFLLINKAVKKMTKVDDL